MSRPTHHLANTVLASLAALWPGEAAAYIGPGIGVTMLGALWAVAGVLVVAVGSTLYWPFRYWRRRRSGGEAAEDTEPESGTDDAREG